MCECPWNYKGREVVGENPTGRRTAPVAQYPERADMFHNFCHASDVCSPCGMTT